MPFAIPHLVAGFIAVMVGYTSSAAIVFQAASAAGADAAQISSWLFALGLGMGVTCIGLSLRYRAPVMIAWSTPGAALLVSSLPQVPYGEAIGAYILASALIVLIGLFAISEVIKVAEDVKHEESATIMQVSMKGIKALASRSPSSSVRGGTASVPR